MSLKDIELKIVDGKENSPGELGTVEYIREDLLKKCDDYALRSYNHKKHEKYYGNLFRGLGFPQVVFGIVVSVMFGSSGFVKPYDVLSIIGFCFGFTQTVLAATLVFFNIQGVANKHHNTSAQLSDLHKDLRVFLLYERNIDDLEEQETLMLEKEKFIDGYSPNLSGTIGVVKEIPG